MDLAAFDLPTFLRGATQEVFDTMLSMELTEQEHQEFTGASRIVGSVSLAGSVSGTVNIHVSDTFASQITANMLGMELDEIDSDEEVHDVIGELSNMIGGDLKSHLCDAGFTCELSIPSITSGKDFSIESKGWAVNEIVYFQYQEHIALIEAFIKNGG
jgi:CheY-specific phosphatase CheX